MDLREIDRLERLLRGLRLTVVSQADLELEVTHEDVLEAATVGGATAVELSVPGARTTDLVRRGTPLRALAGATGVLFFVLNDVDAAAGLRADGVFLDGADVSLRAARRMLGSGAYLGVPVETVKEALQAEADGADFVRVAAGVRLGEADRRRDMPDSADLELIVSNLRIPVTVWEGEDGRMDEALSSWIAGITSRDRVSRAEDIESYCLRLRAAVERALRSSAEERTRRSHSVTRGR